MKTTKPIKIRNFKPRDLDKICQFKKESASISFPGCKIDIKAFKKMRNGLKKKKPII